MPQPQILTISSILGLVNPRGLYMVAYSWLFGMSLWITFFGGVIAFKALPRDQFGALQHKTFPIYFIISIALSSTLLAYWAGRHPNVITHITEPRYADVAQAYTLAMVTLSQSFNYFVVGPMTSKVMFQRQRLEKEEGKSYGDPGVSANMKSLNRKFGMLHGISSLANLGAVLALGFHGLWIGNVGI